MRQAWLSESFALLATRLALLRPVGCWPHFRHFLSDPGGYAAHKLNRSAIMIKQQLELSLDSACGVRSRLCQPRRLSRARWWFTQMRRLVDRGLDGTSPPPARPEQTDMPLPRREDSAQEAKHGCALN